MTSEESVEEWTLGFHGNHYIINLLCNDVLLTLEVEDEESGERWSGEFTSQYIEETTHKAGNFKKFGVFTKMLSSAFSKSNESVFVDLLTLADLELLKARKSGHNSSNSVRSDISQSSNKKQMKRYVILTYTGEFDRVHYPLPLAFEDHPNPLALQRTIRRLRSKLKEKISLEQAPSSEKEKELRQIVSQLRQENTELRHRVRQSTSRSARSSHNLNASFVSNIHSPGDAVENAATVNADLASTNRKLKKQLEELKKELLQSAQETEKVKRDCAKEIMKWKKKISESAVTEHSTKSRNKQESEMVAELRRKLVVLERELKLERLSKGIPSSRPSSSPRLTGGDWNSSVAVNSLSARNSFSNRRASSASLSTRETLSRNDRLARSRSTSPFDRNVPESQLSKHSSVSSRAIGGSKRESSPKHRSTMMYGKENSSNNHNNLSLYSPSSSLGRRFDPTAYQLSKDSRSKSTKAWGAGSSVTRYRYDSPSDSGYSSSNSQSSYNSRRSNRSDSSNQQHQKKKSKRIKQGAPKESKAPTSAPRDLTRNASPFTKKEDPSPRKEMTIVKSNFSTRARDSETVRPTKDSSENGVKIRADSIHADEDVFMIRRNSRDEGKFGIETNTISQSTELKDAFQQKSIQPNFGGMTSSTLQSSGPRHSFELKSRTESDANTSLSTSLVEQVSHVDNDISDIDKRIQALQSYLDNARANMKIKDEKQ